MQLRCLLLSVLVLFCPSLRAMADTLSVTYSGTSPAGVHDVLSFTLPSNPNISQTGAPFYFVTTPGNPSSFDGSGNLSSTALIFDSRGGVLIDGAYGLGTPSYTHFTLTLGGPALFTGTVFNPTILAGTYQMGGTLALQPLVSGSYISYGTAGPLVIATSTAPEPGSFALLGTGLLGVIGLMRRRFV